MQASQSNEHKSETRFSIFEPSITTKRCYFGVRKKEKILGGIRFPGLFSVENGFDGSLTISAIIIEIIALFFLAWIIKISSPDMPLLLLLVGVSVFVLSDLFFAWSHHFSLYPEKNKLENEKLRIFPSMRDYSSRDLGYNDYIRKCKIASWRRFISYLSLTIIIVLAILKFLLYTANVGAFFDLTKMPIHVQIGITILVFLAYLYTAYVHCFHTGLWFAYHRLKIAENRDINRLDATKNADERKGISKRKRESEHFSLEQFIEDLKSTGFANFTNLIPHNQNEIEKQIAVGINTIPDSDRKKHFEKHFIEQIETPQSQKKEYKIVAYGLLFDDQLEAMVDIQNTPLAKAAIALWGHNLQLNCLN